MSRLALQRPRSGLYSSAVARTYHPGGRGFARPLQRGANVAQALWPFSSGRGNPEEDGEEEDAESPSLSQEDYAAMAARLNSMVQAKSSSSVQTQKVTSVLTGPELRAMVYERYTRTYDVRLRKIGAKVYLQIMWRYLEQQSFPLTEREYDEQLSAVAELVTEWGMADVVRKAIGPFRKGGHPGYTPGGAAKCISIPLPVDPELLKKSNF